MPRTDGQIVELRGRNWLVGELLRAGLEVARPERDRGIDLITYADLDAATGRFVARPIQMKAALARSFDLQRRYAQFPELILAYIWHLEDPRRTFAYALTFAEAERIAERLGWTTTKSWTDGGRSFRPGYGTRSPSRKLVELLEPHLMDAPGKWHAKVTGRGPG